MSNSMQNPFDIDPVSLFHIESPPVSKNGGRSIPPACDGERYTWLLKANTTTELKECI